MIKDRKKVEEKHKSITQRKQLENSNRYGKY